MSRESPNTERESEPGYGQRRLGDERDDDSTGGVPDAAFRRLHEAVAGDGGPTRRRQALLSVVREAVDADTVFLTHVDPDRDRWEVVTAVGRRLVDTGEEADLRKTLCRRVVENGTVAVADTRRIVDDPAYWQLGLGSYLGVQFVVDGQTVGTLAVAGASARAAYGDDERALLRAAATVAGSDRAVAGVEATAPDPKPLDVPASWFDGGMLTADEDGRVTRVDDAAAAMLDRPPEAMLNVSVSTAIGHRDDDRVAHAISEVRESGTPVSLEVCHDDALLWIGVYAGHDGVNVYLREATERREHERVLERVTDGFLSLDGDLTFSYVNSHAGDFLDRTPESLEGAAVDSVTGDEGHDDALERTLPQAVRQARDQGETVGVEARTPDGRWVHARVYPDDGGVSVYLHDVTERRRREQLLDGLLAHTRDLLAVESRRTVADVVTAAVEDAAGFAEAQVFLHDDSHGLLVPAGSLDDPNALATGPVHEPGDGPVGRAFVDDEPQVPADPASADPLSSGPATAGDGPVLAVPLGDHGVVAVRTTTGSTVSEDDVSLVSFIAETAVAALDRARRSERLSTYEQVLDASRDLVYAIDDGGQLSFVSPALADRLGHDPDRLVGEHLTAILSAPGSRAVAGAVRRLPGSDDDGIGVETEAVTADDERVPVEVAVSVIPGDDEPAGAVGVVREIDDLEAVREELSRERTRFSRLFEALPDPALEVEVEVGDAGDGASTVRTVNPAFEQAFDVDTESVTGEPLAETVQAGPDTTDAKDPVERVERAVRNRQSVSFQVRQPTSEGLRDFVFQVIPYRETDDCVRAFGIYTDITEQRDRERRLEVLNRVLRHNMRTQLNVVDGYADYLSGQLADAEGGDEGETISVDVDPNAVTAAQRVRQSAGRVLDLADEARRTLEMIDRDRDDGPVDVAGVARSVVDEFDAEHPDASVELRVQDERAANVPEPDGGAPQHGADDGDTEAVVADVGHDIGLAIAQLVENGIVHNHDDPTVEVRVRQDGRQVRITVSDDGPGIPRHERAVVAGETEPTQLEHGSGLGLWMVRWVAEGYGGTVVFPDDAGQGTAVTLRLPSV